MFSNCVVNYKTFVDFRHVFITIKKFKLIRKTTIIKTDLHQRELDTTIFMLIQVKYKGVWHVSIFCIITKIRSIFFVGDATFKVLKI